MNPPAGGNTTERTAATDRVTVALVPKGCR